MKRTPDPVRKPSPVHRVELATRLMLLLAACSSTLAHAQSMPGQQLFNYVTPIILFLTIGAILIALGASLVAPQFARGALYAALIGVVIFFVMKTAPALATAVQQ